MKNTWRHSANTVIYDVIAENPDADEKQLRKLLRDAYPFGQRAMHPYKIWCDAVKKALKLRFVVKPGQQLEITEGLFKQQ